MSAVEPFPQLKMTRDLTMPLPEIELPEFMSVHPADGHERASWNWIMRAAFDPGQDYKNIEDDPACAPERVFFVRHKRMDVATAAGAIESDGTAWVHMVGAHPWYRGLGAGRIAVLAVMRCLCEMGYGRCFLSTDDFRLPAIAVYLSLGFEPVFDPSDEIMARRWRSVREQLALYRKPAAPEPMPLWKELPDPESRRVMPTLTPFVVPRSRGAVIVCPGGAYTHLAPHEGDPIARMINAAGVSAFVLRYTVLPFRSLETPIEEALRAVRLVRSMGYEKVAVMGFSAGGHLCAMAATRAIPPDPEAADPVDRLSSRPDAFAPCYGATSLWHFRKTPWPAALACGKDVFDVIRAYSAECHVTPDTPPAFIWHTADDDVVPVECAYDLARALAAHGVPAEMHVYPHGPHGLGLAGDYEDVSTWAGLCQIWLKGMNYDAPRVI